MKIDPTDKQQFEAYAIACWLSKEENLHEVIETWCKYLWECNDAPLSKDIRKDPGSRIIIALLATLTGIGIHDISTPQQATEEIRRGRN